MTGRSQKTNNDPHLPQGDPGAGMVSVLKRLRAAAQAQLVLQRLGLLTAGCLGVVLLVGLADYSLRLPMAIRLMLWVAGVVTLGWLIKKHVLPALRFRPTLTQVALRVEESDAGKKAGLQGVLASALELGFGEPGSVLAAELGLMTRHQATSRFSSAFTTSSLLARRRLGQALAALFAVALPVGALTFAAPSLARIGTTRVLAPWAGAAWPKRTGVIDTNSLAAHPAGVAFPLRALVTRTSQPDGHTNVTVAYRVIVDGHPGPVQHALLTGQNKQMKFEPIGGAPTVEGELYERLLDTSSMLPQHAPGTPAASVELEYHFETSDDESETARLALVEPPAIIASTVQVVPPAYAVSALASHAAASLGVISGEKDSGNGRDERASIGPILAGSLVHLHLSLSKPLPIPGADEQTPGSAALARWVGATFPGLESISGLSARLGDKAWDISFPAVQSVRVPVILTDLYGITASEDAAYRFDVVEDHPPIATIIQPAQDESILATALIDAAAEGRDDVGLASVTLRVQSASPPAGSAGAPPDAKGEPVDIAAATSAATDTPAGAGGSVLRASALLDVSTLNVTLGEEVWLTAHATDIYEIEGARHAPVVSSKRRLKIIAESELVEQFRNELAGLRESAKRLEQEQDRLGAQRAGAANEPSKAAEMLPHQDAVGERTAPMGDVVKRLAARADRNRLADKSLDGLLKDAGELIKNAGEQSDKASGALNRLAGKAESRDPAQDSKDLEASQKAVQDDLSQLANMLDKGQDNWAVRRSLEKLLVEQKQLTSQTQATGAATQGQSQESLPQAQKDELDALAKRQEDAAQRASAAIEALQQRSQQMKQADPASSKAMENAAAKARQQQLENKQREAADQIKKNQTGAAQQPQQEAEKAIQAMLDELDKGEEQKNEALRRVLADVIQSLTRLIKQQETELVRLGAVMGGGPADKTLDAGMISVNQNTLGVLAALKPMKEAAEVAVQVDSAAAAQAASITALRAPDQLEANENERVSLARLKEAKALSEKMDQDAADKEADRKLDELKKAYKEALELALVLKADTAPLLGKDLDRRERAAARALAVRQDAIREDLAQLRSKTQEFDDAKVFDYAHARLDRTSAQVVDQLQQGLTPASVGRDQGSVARILQGLLAAIDDKQKKKDDFKEDEGGGGGGGGAGGKKPLVPPIAELKLLRFMQQEAADLTRAASDAGAPAPELESVSRLQKDLADQGKALLERLKKNEDGPGLKEPAPKDGEPKQPDSKPETKPDAKPDPQPRPTTPEPNP